MSYLIIPFEIVDLQATVSGLYINSRCMFSSQGLLLLEHCGIRRDKKNGPL